MRKRAPRNLGININIKGITMQKISVFIFIFLSSVFYLHAQNVIDSPFAGSWYPKNGQMLRLQIQKYLNDDKSDKITDNILAVIMPHAGYQYSGTTAAYAARQIEGRNYSRVIIIGPSHREWLPNNFSIADVKYFKTPLGSVEVDTQFADKLRKLPEYKSLGYQTHYAEHSIQIELPFLQTVLKDFKIVPIMLGSLDDKTAKELASELKPMLEDNTLVVISSDFTHYGDNYSYMPFPLDNETKNNLAKLDMEAVSLIEKKDTSGFSQFMERTHDSICGESGIRLFLYMLPEDSKPILLNYNTSGAITNDYRNSISYAAMAFTGRWNKGKAEVNTDTSLNEDKPKEEWNHKERETLLLLAQKSINYFLNNSKIPSPENLGIEINEHLKEKRGVFVTLTENGELRGCIGEIYPTKSLYQAVINQAVNAAFNDPRFHHVSKSELHSLKYEISVLSIPYRVFSWNDIRLGKDGIILMKNGNRALFLPQVAIEQGWTLEETLRHLSMKAGLPPDSWKDADFMVFQAEVF